MRGSLPRKAMLSYCILGIFSAFSHSAIAHGPEKITPIENDEQFLTGVPDPNTRNANEEGLRGILNAKPSGVADGGLTGQRTNSPAPATAAVTKDPSSASDAESDNKKSQDKRHSKKRKNSSRPPLITQRGPGTPKIMQKRRLTRQSSTKAVYKIQHNLRVKRLSRNRRH